MHMMNSKSLTLMIAFIIVMIINVSASPVLIKTNPEETPGLVEGDMIIPRGTTRGVGLRSLGARWISGIVPYEISSVYNAAEQKIITDAMRRMESVININNLQCIRFRPKVSSDRYYITIVNGIGCSSNVGQGIGVVTLQKPDCLYQGTIMHEFLHTLGFFHEQSRPDRDSYIKVNFENVILDKKSNFDSYSTTYVDTQNTPYDYSSIMHYPPYAFIVNGLPTIQPLQPNVVIGQRSDLSAIDIKEVRMYYNCTLHEITTTTPTTTKKITTTTANVLNPGRWSTTGTLVTPRITHTSTVLLDGRVVTLGGNIGRDTVEIYNPLTQTWSVGKSMIDARMIATATLLPDGRLFVTGGYYYNKYVKTAEIYNPFTNSWSAVSSMNTARGGHQTVYLPSPWNKILVMGGFTDNAPFLKSCEIYDFTSNKWTFTTPMINARVYYTAMYLPSLGKVVAVGGDFYGTAEMYSISTAQWIQSVNTMASNTQPAAVILIPNIGQLLTIGGYSDRGETYLFNPMNNSFTPSASIGESRKECSATLLPSGLVLVSGGYSTATSLYRSAKIYDYRSNTWYSAANMNVARFRHTTVLLNNSNSQSSPVVLAVGGQKEGSEEMTSCELFYANG